MDASLDLAYGELVDLARSARASPVLQNRGLGLGLGPTSGRRQTAWRSLRDGDRPCSRNSNCHSPNQEMCVTTARAGNVDQGTSPPDTWNRDAWKRAIGLRGGDTGMSSASSSGTGNANSGPLWGALQGLGFGSAPNDESEAEPARKKALEEQAAEEREVLRKKREERMARENEESKMGEAADDGVVDSGGIMVAMDTGQEDLKAAKSVVPIERRIWLDTAESMMEGMALMTTALFPVWHALRGLFGLSLLFYGTEFATLAFHVVVFRLSGWKKAAKSKNELVEYYKSARKAMRRAAADVQTAAAIARNDKLKARKEEMMAEKRRLHKLGRVSAEEAKAFIDKYRNEIETIAQEQEIVAAASNSVLAIKSALSYKKLSASINSLYKAVVTSITASTFKRAGQLTLALTCGGLIKRTLIDLLGPIIDPIGYQLELETYVANVLRGPANFYISVIGFLVSAAMFFHFFVDPHKALMVTFVLLGARVMTDYVVAALNPFRRNFGMKKKLDNMPLSAGIYIAFCALGFALHGDAGAIGDYVCRPYIKLLGVLNSLLNKFQISTIDYFS